jgi:hypothetical protein
MYLKNYWPDSNLTHTLPPISNQTIASKSYTCVLSQGIAIVLFLIFKILFPHETSSPLCKDSALYFKVQQEESSKQ